MEALRYIKIIENEHLYIKELLKFKGEEVEIIYEKTSTGYSAYLPDLPGCISTGKNKLECAQNIYEAIQFHLDGLREEGLPIPLSETESEVLLVQETL